MDLKSIGKFPHGFKPHRARFFFPFITFPSGCFYLSPIPFALTLGFKTPGSISNLPLFGFPSGPNSIRHDFQISLSSFCHSSRAKCPARCHLSQFATGLTPGFSTLGGVASSFLCNAATCLPLYTFAPLFIIWLSLL